MRERILVTGAGGPAGINVIKLLRDKYYIVSTDINEYSEGFALSNKYYVIPPASEKEEFIKSLETIIEEENIDLAIPTVDEEIEVLANNNIRHREKLILHPRETVNICLNKLKTYEYLKDKIPEIIPAYSQDPSNIKSEKIVKKPIKSRGSRNIYIGNKDEFEKEEGYFFVEYLPGNEWTVDAIADKDGKLVLAIPRIRLKTKSGVSMIGKIEMNKNILKYVETITEHLKFTGGFNIQFKEDQNKNIKLQEINVRFSGGLDITAASGANLPEILIDLWKGKKPNNIIIKEGIYVKITQVYRWK